MYCFWFYWTLYQPIRCFPCKKYPKKFLTTIIREGASIGANSTIVGGLTIGEFAMIGAGSVVTKNIGRQELWYGNPAKYKGYVCKCGEKCCQSLFCINCKMELCK